MSVIERLVILFFKLFSFLKLILIFGICFFEYNIKEDFWLKFSSVFVNLFELFNDILLFCCTILLFSFISLSKIISFDWCEFIVLFISFLSSVILLFGLNVLSFVSIL